MSYFAQNGMRIYVDGGVNGDGDPPADEPPVYDFAKIFPYAKKRADSSGIVDQGTLDSDQVFNYLQENWKPGDPIPDFKYDPAVIGEENANAAFDGIHKFLEANKLEGYGEDDDSGSSVNVVRDAPTQEQIDQFNKDKAAGVFDRQGPSFFDNLKATFGDAADSVAGSLSGLLSRDKDQATTQDQKKISFYDKEEARFDNPAYYEGADEYKGIFDNLVNSIVDKKGGDPRNVRSYVDAVRYHESGKAGIDAYGARQIVEGKEVGVGKGGYMFGVEGFSLNPDGSLKRPAPLAGQEVAVHPMETAQNRYNTMAEANGWPTIKLTNEQIMDPRTIPPAMQDLLFLANSYQDANYDFSNVTEAKKGGFSGAWSKTHWKGDDSDLPARVGSFKEHAKVFPVYAEGGVIGVTNPTGEGEPTEPEKDYYSSVEAKLQNLTGKPLEGLQNIQGFDWQKADELSSEELGSLNDLVTSIGGGTKGDSGNVIANAKKNLPQIREQIGALQEKGVVDPRVAVKSILKEKGTGRVMTYTIMKLLEATGIINPE